MNIYDFEILQKDGNLKSMKDFKGKTILVVNSATHCGFTYQYDELKQLHEEFSDKGLVILDFPCNQFGEQAKGSDEEITEFCKLNFNTPYEIYSKIEVNGENQIPLFKYLKEQKGFKGFNNPEHPLNDRLRENFLKRDENYEKNDDIKWNFTKFLIDKNGKVINRFEPVDDIHILQKAINEII